LPAPLYARVVPLGERDLESELVTRAAEGDVAALGELVRRYHPRLVRLATSVTGRRDVAEDAAQETWIAVQRGLAGCRDRSAFRSWVFQICVNRTRSLARGDARVVCVAPDELALAEPTDRVGLGAASPAVDDDPDEADEAELLARVRTAIYALPGGQRRVVLLHDVDGLPAGEVCDRLGITAANQRVLLHRGRLRVRQALAG
jgi:RNA polymerase sigma-70 factor (ECF subfamily)